MTTPPWQQKRALTRPGDFVPMFLSLSASCQTLRSTLPANAPAGGWYIASWAFRVLRAAPLLVACRRVVCSSYAAFTATTLLRWILLLVSYTVMMLPLTLITVYQFWYLVLILSLALILFVIFPLPLLVGYKMNYSIQNQVVKQSAHPNSKLVRGIL